MATTSPDNLYSPDSSDPYALTQDLGAMQDSVQTALVRRGNAYVGTSAQRNAFTTAPVGTIWSDTNGSRLVYKRGASAWEPISPEPPKTVTSTPFTGVVKPYSTGNVVTIRRYGEVVTITGIGGVDNASSITGSGTYLGAVLPAGFRPTFNHYFGMNGSGQNTYLLTIANNGNVYFSRYSGTGTNLWLPFTATFVL